MYSCCHVYLLGSGNVYFMLSPDRLVKKVSFICLCICSACITSPSAPYMRCLDRQTPGFLLREPVAAKVWRGLQGFRCDFPGKNDFSFLFWQEEAVTSTWKTLVADHLMVSRGAGAAGTASVEDLPSLLPWAQLPKPILPQQDLSLNLCALSWWPLVSELT